MRIIICDDCPQIIEDIKQIIESAYERKMLIECCADGEGLLALCRKGTVELCFVDIELPGMDGISAAREMRGVGIKANVVFITNYAGKYIDDVFVDMAPYGFITKPVKAELVKYYVDKVLRENEASRRVLEVTCDRVNESIKLSDIMYIEAKGRSKLICCENGEYVTIANMDRLERQLDERFIRCHQSFLVNIEYIASFSAKELTLKNGTVIATSRARAEESKKRYFDFMRRRYI